LGPSSCLSIIMRALLSPYRVGIKFKGRWHDTHNNHTHSSYDRYVCDICDFATMKKAGLQNHRERHEGKSGSGEIVNH